MPTIIDLRPEIEKVSGRIAIVALLILCLCIKVYTTQFWHDMNVDHRVKCKVIDRIVEDETITQDGNSTTKKVNKLVLQIDGDATNNSEDNLQLLCPNCHSLTENYGRLNAKSTRPKK